MQFDVYCEEEITISEFKFKVHLGDPYSDDGITFDARKTFDEAKKEAISALKRCIKKIEGLKEDK